MSQLTCPLCGRSLEVDGAILTACPRCRASMLSPEAKPGDSLIPSVLGETSGKIDLAALMRRVLAEQQPGEEIDSALQRVLERDHPEEAAKMAQTIGQHFKFQLDSFGQSPQQAAKTLAKSQAFISFDAEGKPFLHTMLFQVQGVEKLSPEFRQKIVDQLEKSMQEGQPVPKLVVGAPELTVQGLDDLSEEARAEVLEQIKKAFQEGKPIPRHIVTRHMVQLQGSGGLTTIVLALLVLGAMILAYLLSRH